MHKLRGKSKLYYSKASIPLMYKELWKREVGDQKPQRMDRQCEESYILFIFVLKNGHTL